MVYRNILTNTCLQWFLHFFFFFIQSTVFKVLTKKRRLEVGLEVIVSHLEVWNNKNKNKSNDKKFLYSSCNNSYNVHIFEVSSDVPADAVHTDRWGVMVHSLTCWLARRYSISVLNLEQNCWKAQNCELAKTTTGKSRPLELSWKTVQVFHWANAEQACVTAAAPHRQKWGKCLGRKHCWLHLH